MGKEEDTILDKKLLQPEKESTENTQPYWEEHSDETNFPPEDKQEPPAPSEETGYGEDQPDDEEKKKGGKLRKLTDEELRKMIQERGLDNQKSTSMSTTMFMRTIQTLERIRRNLDVMVLLLHTLVSLACGAIVGIGIYLDNTWIQIGGGGSGIFMLVTLVICMVMPPGRLAKMVNSSGFVQQLQTLSPSDVQKLISTINETAHVQSIIHKGDGR